MGKQIFTRIRKILAILVLVSLIMFLTAASASATATKNTQAHKPGFQAGRLAGYSKGDSDGVKDCIKYGKNAVLTKIAVPSVKGNWTKNYKKDYKDGFKIGYITGYDDARFKCLKK